MNDEVISGEEGNTDTHATPAATDAEQTLVKPRRSNVVVLALLACVAVAALVASASVYYRMRNMDGYGDRLVAVGQHIDMLEDKIRTLDNEYGALGTSIKDIESKQGLLGDSINSMFAKRKDDSEDWALAEVEHLLIIATQQLSLDADVDTALAAMEAADGRLRDMSDPALINTRSQILSDINALKSVNAVDIAGMSMYMADIINRAEHLPLKKSELTGLVQETGGGQSAELEQAPLWKRLLQTVWHELKGLVVITREKDAGVLSLVPEQRYYLYQNLRMELDAARLAILRRDTDNLRASLELVQQWLEKYFDVSETAVANIRDSLRQMSRVTLRPKIPDISSSLETLRAYARERAAPVPAQTGSLEGSTAP